MYMYIYMHVCCLSPFLDIKIAKFAHTLLTSSKLSLIVSRQEKSEYIDNSTTKLTISTKFREHTCNMLCVHFTILHVPYCI